MKAVIYIILATSIFCSCETKNVQQKQTDFIINGFTLEIYTIDNCEYIGSINGLSTDQLTHKGNCKFCLERSRK